MKKSLLVGFTIIGFAFGTLAGYYISGLANGWTGAKIAERLAWTKNFTIKRWSGGELVESFTSRGKVETENDSDGWMFIDSKTGKFTRVSGEVTIEEIK